MADEIGSNTWTVTGTYTTEQPGVYGDDDCAGAYRTVSGSALMTYDQPFPDDQWMGVVVFGSNTDVLITDVVRDGTTYTETLRVLSQNGKTVLRFETWDGLTVDREMPLNEVPNVATTPVLITWKHTYNRLINNVDGLIFNQSVLSVWADSRQGGQFTVGAVKGQ